MYQVFQTNATKEWFDRIPQEYKPEKNKSELLLDANYVGDLYLTTYKHSDNPLGIAFIKTKNENDAIEYLKLYEERIKSKYKNLPQDFRLIIVKSEFRRR